MLVLIVIHKALNSEEKDPIEAAKDVAIDTQVTDEEYEEFAETTTSDEVSEKPVSFIS